MKISTFFIIVGIVIISFYALIEVNYYSATQTINQKPGDTPYIIIPEVGVDDPINNKSVDYGIYHEPESAKPGNGTVVLFGHRTLHGSPFLKLDQLKPGDNVTLEWPGIGYVEYVIENSTIVPADYRLSVEQGNVLFLITCYPLGSTKERLMIKAKQVDIYPIKNVRAVNPQKNYAIYIIIAFMAIGSVLSFLYPVKDDRAIIFLVVVALTLFLILGYFFPVPPDTLESNMSRASDFLSFGF
ncbi:class E sortase [Methanobacterium petrolearium]|uniref:class E sortase n=1 Tax=Methanobacterium petrolearium TaxID=710190 RepID=UPI001AE2D4F1|nr:class E sortase [Methanobacterium petrolearium]MBP1945067.1 LPXTG-site transpeptidase (sortase) family protein [Methanobacterium petrolearium]BDZ70399.1 sortase [Methanobacterium petrolearium]